MNDNVHEEFFKKICNKTLLMPLIEKLDRCGLMKDFINLMEVLSNGTLDVENIPLLLYLERAKLCKCTNTTHEVSPKIKSILESCL